MQLKKGFCFCPECLHLLPEDKAQGDRTTYSTVKPSIPLRQEELILLQEQVKKGILSVDEALEKFKEWQNHRSGLEATQQVEASCILCGGYKLVAMFIKISLLF